MPPKIAPSGGAPGRASRGGLTASGPTRPGDRSREEEGERGAAAAQEDDRQEHRRRRLAVADLVGLGEAEDVEHQGQMPPTSWPQKGTRKRMLVAWAKLTTRNVASKSRRAPPSSSSTRWRIPAARKTPITTKTPAEDDLRHEAGPALDPAQEGRDLRPLGPNAPRPEPTTERKIAW